MKPNDLPRRTRQAHGRHCYYILREGLVGADSAELPEAGVQRQMIFTRMLPRSRQVLDQDGLQALGEAMHTDTAADPDRLSRVPAGFTYLGQFIDHDVTLDLTATLPSGTIEPEDLDQGRTPSLDLDCLYGNGPDDAASAPMYESSGPFAGVKLRVGTTSAIDVPIFPTANVSLPNDLPRRPDRKAVIGDGRNDENLAVAQTHLAFIKFHNTVVDRLAAGGTLSGRALFEAARSKVVKHYQWILLYDFLPRICEDAALGRAIGAAGWIVGAAAMPVEFSAAAYRLGHSMIRPTYEWNKFFNSRTPRVIGGQSVGAGMASLVQLFQFSGAGGFDPTALPNSGQVPNGPPTLPSNWVVDWNFMYDFGEAGGMRSEMLNFTHRINTSIADPLKNMIPGVQAPSQLASRNLRRGAALSLPTGQEAADYLNIRPLSATEIADGPHEAVLRRHGFDCHTPLWYYILKEAEVRHGGHKLGRLGTLITAGTFISLIKGSRVSILREVDWRPDLPSDRPGTFRMTDLLNLVGDLNPLGVF